MTEKITDKIYDIDIWLNAHDLFDDKLRELGKSDKYKGRYLIGFSIKLGDKMEFRTYDNEENYKATSKIFGEMLIEGEI